MMAQNKHLHELLKEDQEPFLLNNYISHRRNQLKRPSSKTALQLKKQKPLQQITATNSTTSFLCRNACFLHKPLQSSPLFEQLAPKSPCRSSPSNNAIYLQIPAKTASLLLDAALRIQKQSKTAKSNKFAVLGSFLKRITHFRNRKSEIGGGANSNCKVSVKDLLRWDSSVGSKMSRKLKNVEDACSCDGRRSSAVWSEKSMNMEEEDEETSTSCGHSSEKENADCDCCFADHDDHTFFCQSPFQFALQKSPSASSSGRRTPEFASPASSPGRRGTQDKESDNGVNEFQSKEEDEEEKEQCSPVSVLDTPFEDDENDDEEGRFDLECSYANVQRSKQLLLDRLSRFEKLAELDPIELEKRMLDQEDESVTFTEEDESETSCEEMALREIVYEILCDSSVHDKRRAPEDLKRLVYDLIMEEERELGSSEDRNMVMERVCRKLELWKEVEPNTIDMMIQEDFSREENGWKKNSEQKRDLAGEIELAIFCFLVDELSEELVC